MISLHPRTLFPLLRAKAEASPQIHKTSCPSLSDAGGGGVGGGGQCRSLTEGEEWWKNSPFSRGGKNPDYVISDAWHPMP